jgi:DNA-binding response OmpR family regulator
MGSFAVEGLQKTRVRLLRWPAEEKERRECDRLNIPRLLVLEAGVAAPECRDALEDWIRPPVLQTDVDARVSALRQRAADWLGPRVDNDGTLRIGGSSIILSPIEAAIVKTLAGAGGAIVPRDQLARVAAVDCDSPISYNALHLQVFRLRKRLNGLNLTIGTAWGRGYALRYEGPD